ACIELVQEIEIAALQLFAWFDALQVCDGCRWIAKNGPLMDGWQKAAMESVGAAGRNDAVAEDDVSRQFLVFAPQAIRHPRADARLALRVRAGVQKQIGVGVLGEVS